MTHRIAFTGASGTGKSTLATWVADKLALPLNPVGARSVAKQLGFVNEAGDPDPYQVDRANLLTYEMALAMGDSPEVAAAKACSAFAKNGQAAVTCRELFQYRTLVAKIAWEEIHHTSGYVTDRTTCDNLAYAALQNPRRCDASDYRVKSLRHMRNYTDVFFCPIQSFHSLGDDTARDPNKGYHHVYEMLLYGALSASLIPFHEIFRKVSGILERQEAVMLELHP